MKTLALIVVCVGAAWLVGCSSPCMESAEKMSVMFRVVCHDGASLTFEQIGNETYAHCSCAKDGGAK